MITTNYSQANVTISGGITTALNTPSASQTLVNARAATNGSTNNVYTVTAGKTFYLMGFTYINGVAGTATIYLNDASTIVGYGSVTTTTQFSTVSSATPIASYSSTQNVKVNGTTGGSVVIWGFEQ